MTSIRNKLLFWLIIGQLFSIALTGAITFSYVRSELEGIFDDRLRQLAYSVPLNAGSVPAPPPDLNNVFEDDDDFIIQVWNRNDEHLMLINIEEGDPGRTDAGYSTHVSDNMAWRSFGLQRDGVFVQVSQPLAERLEMSLNISLLATAPIIILIVLLGGLAWVTVRKSLAPLNSIANSLKKQSPYSLTPVALTALPDEILPLAKALNSLLVQLERALSVQRKFTADAAHELRTPLTAIDLQTQLLERCHDDQERRELFTQLRSGISRSSHLVEQLLTLARMEPDKWERPFVRINMSELLRQSVADLTSAALHRQIDLGINRSEPVQIFGDSESLRILLNNLIDNAIRYSYQNGRIDVELYRFEQLCRVVVKDNGPGIPVSERQRVFDRFYRHAGQNGNGSGLGLAIVREIVRQHHGQVQLEDGDDHHGLKVVVSLPVSDPDSDGVQNRPVK